MGGGRVQPEVLRFSSSAVLHTLLLRYTVGKRRRCAVIIIVV